MTLASALPSSCQPPSCHLTPSHMEPRIATLLDQSPYKRLTLDPSVLTTPSSVAPRYIEHVSSVSAGRSNPDSHGHHDYVDTRHKASSQAHSSAPLARVLNDPASSSPTFHPSSGRQTPQHATFRTRSDVPVPRHSTISPDARRRDEQSNLVGYSGGDVSLIQLPKPPQAPRRTAKRPRIPPLLQGLHQPPPLPPKNKLFPPISERSGPGNDVGDRFGLTSAFPISNTKELAKARASPEKRHEPASDDAERTATVSDTLITPRKQGPSGENTSEPSSATLTTGRAQTKVKTARKRTKWSQNETEDLLIGVSRFGIGRWKQILECSDFNFQGRTAVDLKDRFRVCRPGEGLKARKAATPEVFTATKQTEIGQAVNEAISPPTENASPQSGAPAQQASIEGTDANDQAASKPTEVYGPFMKSRRRARREFSDVDDKNLLKGFKRHGPVWHAMRDDFELGFGMRHPTDLRDRFRIRYPDLFAKAGYTLKPKERRALKEAQESKAQEGQVSKQPTTTVTKTVVDSDKSVARASATTDLVQAPAPATTSSKPTSTRPTFDLVTDFTFDDDEGDRSPIVLNRNILQWADENSTSIPSTATATTNPQIPTHTSSDLLYNPFAVATDGLHINPLATLKLPSTAHWSYMNPPITTPLPSLPPPAPSKHSLPASSASASAARAQQDMRMPNLPNIVFPYVPNASARNAVHNLPAPADILSERQVGTGEGYVWIG